MGGAGSWVVSSLQGSGDGASQNRGVGMVGVDEDVKGQRSCLINIEIRNPFSISSPKTALFSFSLRLILHSVISGPICSRPRM